MLGLRQDWSGGSSRAADLGHRGHERGAGHLGSGDEGAPGRCSSRATAYPLTIGGLGAGGIGIPTIDAKGEVYKLNSMAQFAGAYAQARYGFAIGATSRGDLWMQNESGVIMHLEAKREGLMLSLGGDAIVISMQE